MTLTHFFWSSNNLTELSKHFKKYLNVPKFSDIQVLANSADPDQTAPLSSLIRLYTVCHCICIF